MSPEFQLIAVQYYCHVSPSVSLTSIRLSLEAVWVTWYGRISNIYIYTFWYNFDRVTWWYGRISNIYTFWYNFDTVLCQFFDTGTLDRCLKGIVQRLRLSGFILYPLSFFLYNLFNDIHKSTIIKLKIS